jgi:hypothetical protein
MRKRIILLLDGTWADAEFGLADTNIVRLREIIFRSLIGGSVPIPPRPRGPQLRPGQRIASGRTSDDAVENLVFYERGVGTDAFDRLRGGTFGDGLERSVRRAYRFLSFYYRGGDEVFVFGFSRGAYTARSLIGYIAAAGLLRQQWCTGEMEDIAWRFYRTTPNDRLPGTWAYLSPYVHDRPSFSIDCIGLFDTVGALGVPLNLFRRINRQRNEFHGVDLASITKVNLHALAVDEHRVPFQASIWRRPKFKDLSSVTEQVWFSGAHADIGGGYYTEDQRTIEGTKLDDIVLDWMLKRLRSHFPRFPLHLEKTWKTVSEADVRAEHHNPRRHAYRAFPYAIRSICNYPTTASRRFFEKEVCLDRHADTVGEMIHVSVLQRLGFSVRHDKTMAAYRPKNVLAVLDIIEASYGVPGIPKPVRPILIVDWDGRPLDPVGGRDNALAIISSARERLSKPLRCATLAKSMTRHHGRPTAPGGDEGIVSIKDGPAATSGLLPEEKVPKTR